MSYREEWDSISIRIRSLAESGTLYARLLESAKSDSYGMWKNLGAHCRKIFGDIEEFEKLYRNELTPFACVTLKNHLDSDVINFGAINNRESHAMMVSLLAFESEFSHKLRKRQERLRLLSERAFLHLQRTIAVDEVERDKWKNSFKSGELECEKLGSIHLLRHGIWAFKIDSLGARTDLVFSEPISDIEVGRSAEGLF
jgi:hypothetical protein